MAIFFKGMLLGTGFFVLVILACSFTLSARYYTLSARYPGPVSLDLRRYRGALQLFAGFALGAFLMSGAVLWLYRVLELKARQVIPGS